MAMTRHEILKKKAIEWRNNIETFAWDNFKFIPDDWQKEMFENIRTKPRTAIKSGQGVGKTGGEAIIALWFLWCFPNSKVICTAPTKHQLNDVLWSEIAKWQKKSPLLSQTLKWTKTYIYVTGCEERWFAVARTATKPENMQGFHEDNMLFIVDEASGVADPIMEAIQGTLSGANNKLLACGNPTKSTGFFYDCFTVSRNLYACQTVNSEDSPRTNKENIKALIQKYGRDSNVVRVRVLGEFPKAESDVFIPISLVEGGIMTELPEEKRISNISLGVDVARFGDDETIIAQNIDGNITIPIKRHGQNLMATVGDIVTQYRKLIKDNPRYKGNIHVNIDDTGLGGGVTDRLNEVKREEKLFRMEIIPVNFGEEIPNEEAKTYYSDLPTYMWSIVRKGLEDREIKLPNDGDLVAQLSTRKYDMASNGKVKIESKKEMKKRGLPSPDTADAVALSMFKKKIFNLKSML